MLLNNKLKCVWIRKIKPYKMRIDKLFLLKLQKNNNKNQDKKSTDQQNYLIQMQTAWLLI